MLDKRNDYLLGLLRELYPETLIAYVDNKISLDSMSLDLKMTLELSEARLTLNIAKDSEKSSSSNEFQRLVLYANELAAEKELATVSIKFVKEINGEYVDPKESTCLQIYTPLFNIENDTQLRENTLYLFVFTDLLLRGMHEKSLIREGREISRLIKRYERSPALRAQAINHHGLNCKICGLNFENIYGSIGSGFIHVHHLERLSDTGQRFVDPQTDLIPVCPNCHAMLHRKIPPYTPKELTDKLNRRTTK